MHDMLAAFHLVRYFDIRRREQEPARDVIPGDYFAVGLHLSRKLRAEAAERCSQGN